MAGAQQFILEKVPAWLRKYGPQGQRVAFFATNDAHTGIRARNLALVYMDCYVLGGVDGVRDRHYLGTTAIAVPGR